MEIKQKQFVSLEIHMMKCLTQMYEMYDTDLLYNFDLEPKWWGFEVISPYKVKYKKCEFPRLN